MATQVEPPEDIRCQKRAEALPLQTQYIRDWITCAEEEATTAKECTRDRIPLFLVQQSVEKMVKAWRLVSGSCFCDVFAIGHESLRGFQQHIEMMIDSEPARSIIAHMVGRKADRQLQEVNRLTRDPEGRMSILLWDRETVGGFLDAVDNLEVKIERQVGVIDGRDLGTIKYQSREQFRDALGRRLMPLLRSVSGVDPTVRTTKRPG